MDGLYDDEEGDIDDDDVYQQYGEDDADDDDLEDDEAQEGIGEGLNLNQLTSLRASNDLRQSEEKKIAGNKLQKSSLQASKVVQNERGEFVTIGEIEEPTRDFKSSIAHLSKGLGSGEPEYNMAEQISRHNSKQSSMKKRESAFKFKNHDHPPTDRYEAAVADIDAQSAARSQ